MSELDGSMAAMLGDPPPHALDPASLEPDSSSWDREYERHYTAVRVLGHGTFGEAILAFPKSDPQRRVVLKIPSEHRRALALLRSEADRLRSLSHPRIVGFRDFVEVSSSGWAYLVMDYVEGGSLAALLQARGRRFLTQAEVAKVVVGILQALDYIHSKGVYHLDIK